MTLRNLCLAGFIAFAALSACAAATNGGEPSGSVSPAMMWNNTGEGFPKRLSSGLDRISCGDAFSDERCAPWYHPGTDPIAGQMWFMIAYDGSGCPVPVEYFTMAAGSADFTCRWRMPR